LAGDLNAKHPLWNCAVSNPSGKKLLQMLDVNEFEITAPQCPTHYSPAGNGDMLDIVVHKNIRLSHVTVSDILNSDHLPIVIHILDHVSSKKTLGTNQKIYGLETASNLISPRIEINSKIEANKVACHFTATIASAHRLSTSKITLSKLNNDLPGLDQLLNTRGG
jgi:hypothetical protein